MNFLPKEMRSFSFIATTINLRPLLIRIYSSLFTNIHFPMRWIHFPFFVFSFLPSVFSQYRKSVLGAATTIYGKSQDLHHIPPSSSCCYLIPRRVSIWRQPKRCTRSTQYRTYPYPPKKRKRQESHHCYRRQAKDLEEEERCSMCASYYYYYKVESETEGRKEAEETKKSLKKKNLLLLTLLLLLLPPRIPAKKEHRLVYWKRLASFFARRWDGRRTTKRQTRSGNISVTKFGLLLLLLLVWS